jgi:hypothetical protein
MDEKRRSQLNLPFSIEKASDTHEVVFLTFKRKERSGHSIALP